MSDAVTAPHIITPHALPMFRDMDPGRGTKRKRDKDRLDPRKSRRPELPVTGPGKGGRVGASATQHVVQNLVRDTTRDEDVSLAAIVIIPLPSFPLLLSRRVVLIAAYLKPVSLHKSPGGGQNLQHQVLCAVNSPISGSLPPGGARVVVPFPDSDALFFALASRGAAQVR